MRVFNFGRYAVGLITAAFLFSACTAGGGQTAYNVGPPATTSIQKGSQQSYMLPRAQVAKQLLYVSSFYFGRVHVYDYHAQSEVGEITGLGQPTGQCVDAKGDVWISQADPHLVVEYPRASLRQIREVQTFARPFGCSVSPNGDLAVAEFDRGSAPGDVEVFKNGSGRGTMYACNGFSYYPNSPGYDDKGNLFVEGLESLQQNVTGVCLLPAGGNVLAPVNFGVALHDGGGAMWDGKYMTLADVELNGGKATTTIYQVTINASRGLTVAGSTVLANSSLHQPFILGGKNTPVNVHQGHAVVGPDNYHVGEWTYPAGVKKGVPFEFYPREIPFGESISIGN